MLMNLKRSGKLGHLSGLVVGMFTATKKEPEETFTQSIEEIIMDKVAAYGYPVCFGFPSGHASINYALKMGAMYDLNISTNSVTLFEQLLPNTPSPTAPKMMIPDMPMQTDSLESR
jgi:muramoyltetrapeptide carboxypeptidase